jgi:hypothetical protein
MVNVLVENNGVWHIVVATPSKLLGAFILEMKIVVLFTITNAILEVDPSIQLEIKSTSTNVYGRQTWS